MMPIYETSNKGIHHTHDPERWGALSGKATRDFIKQQKVFMAVGSFNSLRILMTWPSYHCFCLMDLLLFSPKTRPNEAKGSAREQTRSKQKIIYRQAKSGDAEQWGIFPLSLRWYVRTWCWLVRETIDAETIETNKSITVLMENNALSLMSLGFS